MRKRSKHRYRPRFEPLETKDLPSAAVPAVHRPHLRAAPLALANHRGAHKLVVPPSPARGGITDEAGGGGISAQAVKPNFGYLVYRITNPSGTPNTLNPPFGHVLVQARQPVPGQWYNILLVTVKNNTKETFDSSSGFLVRFPQQLNYFPILTGDQKWYPGQNYTFYVLTKKYYPMPSQVTSGFQFVLGGAWSVAIPGPSGIFLRIRYNPNTINKILDYAVTRGPGIQGGKGLKTGMADTAIYAFVSATKNRNDFGGYF